MFLVASMLLSQVPVVRTIKSQIGEERPLSICQLSVQASAIVRGRVVSVGSTVQLADAATSQAYLFTPVEFAPIEVLAGTMALTPTTIYMLGEATMGRSQNGSVFSSAGIGVEGIAFLVEHGGVKFVHLGGGWFWEGQGGFSNPFGIPGAAKSLATLRQDIATSVSGNGGCTKVLFVATPPGPSIQPAVGGDGGVK